MWIGHCREFQSKRKKLTLKTSAMKLFPMTNLHWHSVDKTKSISLYIHTYTEPQFL